MKCDISRPDPTTPSYSGGIFLDSEINVTIGGDSPTEPDNFNDFTGNYKTGSSPSSDQHIRKYDAAEGSVDCHEDYDYNNFDPDL